MRWIRTVTLVMTLSAAGGSGLLAQQKAAPAAPAPAAVDAARSLLKAMGSDSQFDTAIRTIARGLAGVVKQQRPEHAKAVDEVFELMIAKFIARKAEAIDMVAPLYAEKFSITEMQEIAAFYATPIGKKLLAVQPEIMQRSMTMDMAWGQRIGQEIDAEANRELQKRGVPI